MQLSVWERQLFVEATLEAGSKRPSILSIQSVISAHSCSAAVTVATCGNYTTVMPFIPHTEHESVYIQGGCYPLTDERLNPSFPLFFTPFLEYPTCGSITLNNQLLQVASKWKATGINNESSDYMPRAKPQFSVYLAGSQLFIQLDTEQ